MRIDCGNKKFVSVLVAVEVLVEAGSVAFLLFLAVCILFHREAILRLKVRIVIVFLLIGRVCGGGVRGGACERLAGQSRDSVLEGSTRRCLNLCRVRLLLREWSRVRTDTSSTTLSSISLDRYYFIPTLFPFIQYIVASQFNIVEITCRLFKNFDKTDN